MTGPARNTIDLIHALQRLDRTLEIVLLNPYTKTEHPWYRELPTYALPVLASCRSRQPLGTGTCTVQRWS